MNAVLLASGHQALWGYVHTSQNPADRPSRRGTLGKKAKHVEGRSQADRIRVRQSLGQFLTSFSAIFNGQPAGVAQGKGTHGRIGR